MFWYVLFCYLSVNILSVNRSVKVLIQGNSISLSLIWIKSPSCDCPFNLFSIFRRRHHFVIEYSKLSNYLLKSLLYQQNAATKQIVTLPEKYQWCAVNIFSILNEICMCIAFVLWKKGEKFPGKSDFRWSHEGRRLLYIVIKTITSTKTITRGAGALRFFSSTVGKKGL